MRSASPFHYYLYYNPTLSKLNGFSFELTPYHITYDVIVLYEVEATLAFKSFIIFYIHSTHPTLPQLSITSRYDSKIPEFK